MLIKAGTYRFNDVLISPSSVISEDINFTCKASVEGVGELDAICSNIWVNPGDGTYSTPDVRYTVIQTTPDLGVPSTGGDVAAYWAEDGAWNEFYGGELLQTITIPNDTEVSAEFYEWFTANAVEQKQISGVWKFKDELTAEDGADIKQSVNFHYDLSGADFGVDIDVRLYCSGFRVFWQSAYYDFNWLFVDIDRIEPSQVDVGGTAYDVATALGYSVPGDNPIHKGSWSIPVAPTIDFGAEPQYVSAEFYDWFIANANPVVASIHYNGSTIASLFGGDTATVKIKGNGEQVIPDIVVEVAEGSGGGSCNKPHVIEVTELPTENIDEDALYLCNGGYYKYAEEFSDVRPCGEGQDLTGVDGVPTFSEALGLPIASYHYAPTMPTENIEVSTETGLAVYYIEDANNLFAYVGEWISLTDMFPDIPFLGAISDASESTEGGYYAILSVGWKALTITSGTLGINKNGKYDIADKMNVNVSIPTTYVVQTASDLSADAPNGSLAIVLRG